MWYTDTIASGARVGGENPVRAEEAGRRLPQDGARKLKTFNPQVTMKKLFTVAAALLLTAVVYAGEIQDITIPDLKAAIDAKQVTLLDANGTKSWKGGHIPGAIDFKANQEKLASLLPADKSALVVAYCGGPKCVAYKAAIEAAQKLGYTNIKHLPAGISGWTKAGEPTDKGS
jgi:rhodanese-related sulfurtransferase